MGFAALNPSYELQGAFIARSQKTYRWNPQINGNI
jgi:hypothetical protein